MNPFIYAFKHEAVKEKLARLIVCRKHVAVTAADASGSNDNDNSRNIVVGTQQSETGTAHQ